MNSPRTLLLGAHLLSSLFATASVTHAQPVSAPLPAVPNGPTSEAAFLSELNSQWQAISSQVTRNSLVSQRLHEGQWVVEFKTLGLADTVTLTGGPCWVGIPRVSRDASTFYIQATPGGGSAKRLVIALVPGKSARLLASLPAGSGVYDVSPDGKHLAYQQRIGSTSGYQIHIMVLATGESRQFTDPSVGGLMPNYSPDGSTIAYFSKRKLRLKNVASGVERVMADDSLLKELPTWAPDGRTITYQATAVDHFSYDVWKIDVASGKQTQLTRSTGLDVNPVFTGDGQSIIFTSERQTKANNPTVYLMDADGTNLRRDTTAGNTVFFPSISSSAVIVANAGLVKKRSDWEPRSPETTTAPVTVAAAVATPAAPMITPTPPPPPPAKNNITYTIDALLASLRDRQADVDRCLAGDHVFYYDRQTTGLQLQAKVLGNSEAITLAELPHSSLAPIDVRGDRRALFFKFIDQAGRSTHIVQLEQGKPPRDLVELPLVPDLAFERFDLSEDASAMYFDLRIDELTTIYRYDIASGQPELLLQGDQGGVYPALSPDGKRLAYTASGKLLLMDLTTSVTTTLVDDPLQKQYPSWSLDSNFLIYQASTGTSSGLDVFATDLTGRESVQVTKTEGDDCHPAYVSSSYATVFTSDRNTTGFGRLYFIASEGAQPTLDPAPHHDVLFPR